MKNNILTILILMLMHFSNAQSVKQLSLNEAFSLATQNSHQLQLDSIQANAISIKKEQVKNAMLPIVGISTAYARLSDNIPAFGFDLPGVGSVEINTNVPNQFRNQVSVQQPIFQGLKNWNTIKALDQQLMATDFDKLKDEEDLKLMVVQYYYQLYILQQRLNLLDSNILQISYRVDELTKQRDAGLILNNDVMRAELQKTNFLVEKVNTESNLATINYYLNVLLGLPTDTKCVVAAPNITTTSIASDVAYLIDDAQKDRVEFKAQDFRLSASNYQIKAAKAAYMPTISAVANGQYNNPNQRVFPLEAKFKATWDVGISLNWNIMQLYTARSVVNDAKNQKAQLEIVTKQLKDKVATEVNTNYQALKVAQAKIDLAQQAIDQATENKRILDNRFNAQVALLTDVLDADVFLFQAKTNLFNAKADEAIAYYKLQKSLGRIK
ncbi:MAG: TolC family protein [Chitinophagales bacterium]|nr:TolC family protein [Chitinophagales bacterium]